MACEALSKETPLIQISLSKESIIYPGPYTGSDSVEDRQITQISLLPVTEQLLKGFLIFQYEEANGYRTGCLAVSDDEREEILKCMRPLEEFLVDNRKSPSIHELLMVDPINRFIGEIVNPELTIFPK